MAHNNGMIPRKGARAATKGMSEASAKFRAAADAVPIEPAGTAYDPGPPEPSDIVPIGNLPLHGATGAELAGFVPHRPARPGEVRRRHPVQAGQRIPAGRRPADRDRGTGRRRRSADERDQVLLGVTGSGKTFTMAKVIEAVQRPALILAPNKTLAAQLYCRDQELLPGERGRVFRLLLRLLPAGSLYPAHRHLYREGFLGKRRDRPHAPFGDAGDPGARRRHHRRLGVVHLRHRRGRDLFGHRGHHRRAASKIDRTDADRATWSALQYRRNDDDFARGAFRVRGDTIDIFPAHYEDRAWRVELFGDEVDSITEFDPLTGRKAGDARQRSRSTPIRTM